MASGLRASSSDGFFTEPGTVVALTTLPLTVAHLDLLPVGDYLVTGAVRVQNLSANTNVSVTCLLTGGGDCPGLNAVIRGAVRKGIGAHGHVFTGFRYGWAGVLDGIGLARCQKDAHVGLELVRAPVEVEPTPAVHDVQDLLLSGQCSLG